MNTGHPSAFKVPAQCALWVVSLLASTVLGWYAGRFFISATLWMGQGRSCPEGWLGLAIGLGLLGSGVLLRRRWGAYAAAFLCGAGCGFVVWPGFLIWWSRVAPSC